MRQTNFIIFIVVLVVLTACNTEINNIIFNKQEIIFTTSNSPYFIKEDLVVDSTKKMVIEGGTELVFQDSAKIIIFGSIQIDGDDESPIILKPDEPGRSWGGIRILNPNDSCSIKGTKIYNGLIYGERVDFIMENSSMINKDSLDNFDALIRLFEGSVQIKNSYFESNHTGEGIIIHDTKLKTTKVENCEFHQIADAVEFINVHHHGIIKGNRFYNIQQKFGDGIDLNGCTAIRIESNWFENICDFGIEVGNDKYGPSKRIVIVKNILTDCFKGIVVKGGSNAVVLNNTFYNNDFGVVCMVEHYGANYDPNKIEVINSIFSGSTKNDFQNNENSRVSFRYCLSDSQLLEGGGNIFADPLFIDKDKIDFRLNESSPCRVSGDTNSTKAYDISITDIGAIAYENK